MQIITTAFLILCAGIVSANEHSWSVSLETGAVRQSRDDVRYPGDNGTGFSIDNAVGNGPFYSYRLESILSIDNKNQLRILIAPFHISDTTSLQRLSDKV